MLEIFGKLTSPTRNDLATLERQIGEAVVDCGFALAYGIAQDDAGKPVDEAEEDIERCKKLLTALKSSWSDERVSFEATAYQHAVAVLRERLGPDFSYDVLEFLVKWVLKWYEWTTQKINADSFVFSAIKP